MSRYGSGSRGSGFGGVTINRQRHEDSGTTNSIETKKQKYDQAQIEEKKKETERIEEQKKKQGT